MATTTITSPSDNEDMYYELNFIGTTNLSGVTACNVYQGFDGVFSDNTLGGVFASNDTFNIEVNACDKNLFGLKNFKVVCTNVTDFENDIVYNSSVRCANAEMVAETTLNTIIQLVVLIGFFASMIMFVVIFVAVKKYILNKK